MTGKIDPLKLAPLDFPARPDPRADWTDSAAAIAEALGAATLGPSDQLRLRAGWRYSQATADHFEVICQRFLRHTKGRWAGEPIVWHRWQQEQWIRPLFGWHDPGGLRGIHRAYIECGKKSGKSTFAATVSIYMAQFFGELGAEVYNLAGTEEQARICQHQAEHTLKACAELEQRTRVRRGKDIFFPHSNSIIMAQSGKGASGFNPFCLVMDELHEWNGAQAFERWTYGSMARLQWLHLMITNAGDDTESVCWRQREYGLKVERGEVDDPAYMARVYSSTREEAEAEVESVMGGATRLPVACKCNPGLGTVLREEDLISEIKQAVHIPANLPNLYRFWYCVWRTASKQEWLRPYWSECRSDYTLDDLDGPTWLGLDLSSVIDLSALVACSVQDEGPRYRLWPWFWVPRRRALELRKWTAIEQWEREGQIEVVEGERINQTMIVNKIVELCERLQIRGLLYDPKEATAIVNEVLERTGIDVFPFKQSHENFHEPTDNFEADVRACEIEHPGNLVLSWQAGHAACVETTGGYKKPLKPDQVGAPHKTVDGIQAAVMAYSQALHYDASEEGAFVMELS